MGSTNGQIRWFIDDGETESEPLTEVELRQRLATSDCSTWRVRQNDGQWYPADHVVKKFKELVANGIYIRHDGHTEGPFTASRVYEMLRPIDLNDILAKVGRNGQWISARRLFRRLESAIAKAEKRRAEEQRLADAATSDDGVIEAIPLDTADAADEALEVEVITDDSDHPYRQANVVRTTANRDGEITLSLAEEEPIEAQLVEADPEIIEAELVSAGNDVVKVSPVRSTFLCQCTCGIQMEVSSDMVGQRMQCPSCGLQFVVPPQR